MFNTIIIMDISTQQFLVTGGAGFIGSHISEYLLKMGAKFVRVIDNLSTGSRDNISHLNQYDNFEFILGDITDYNFCKNSMINIDIVCHQAAMGSVPKSMTDPLSYHATNVTGFLNVLNAAKNNGIKRVVYASSSSVYGDDNSLTKSENKTGVQLSPYAITKYLDEMYGNMFTRLYSMECIALRYFNVFGPRQNPEGAYAAVIPKFAALLKDNKSPVIYGDGLQSRDFTFVENVVCANFMAMTTFNSECYGQAFNVGTGGSMTVLDLFNHINTILDKKIDPIFMDKRNGDIEHSLADISKAMKLLNWIPHVSLMDGLHVTISSFL